jgi:hypothetical protein
VVGEERPAESGVLPQRRPLPVADDTGGRRAGAEAGGEAGTDWPVPTPVMLTWVLEGLRRLS